MTLDTILDLMPTTIDQALRTDIALALITRDPQTSEEAQRIITERRYRWDWLQLKAAGRITNPAAEPDLTGLRFDVLSRVFAADDSCRRIADGADQEGRQLNARAFWQAAMAAGVFGPKVGGEPRVSTTGPLM